jgi:hypothetical protein
LTEFEIAIAKELDQLDKFLDEVKQQEPELIEPFKLISGKSKHHGVWGPPDGACGICGRAGDS